MLRFLSGKDNTTLSMALNTTSLSYTISPVPQPRMRLADQLIMPLPVWVTPPTRRCSAESCPYVAWWGGYTVCSHAPSGVSVCSQPCRDHHCPC